MQWVTDGWMLEEYLHQQFIEELAALAAQEEYQQRLMRLSDTLRAAVAEGIHA